MTPQIFAFSGTAGLPWPPQTGAACTYLNRALQGRFCETAVSMEFYKHYIPCKDRAPFSRVYNPMQGTLKGVLQNNSAALRAGSRSESGTAPPLCYGRIRIQPLKSRNLWEGAEEIPLSQDIAPERGGEYGLRGRVPDGHDGIFLSVI
jgi:hypothetical protein